MDWGDSYNVAAYNGQWAEFLESWDVLQQAVQLAPPAQIQLQLNL